MTNILKRANLTLQDFDFYEIHEAFAAQALATLKIWESEELSAKFGVKALGSIDRNKLNVNGSSLGAGHPFAATGGRAAGDAG
jgi:acetyl-CoA C-acetyltransferase